MLCSRPWPSFVAMFCSCACELVRASCWLLSAIQYLGSIWHLFYWPLLTINHPYVSCLVHQLSPRHPNRQSSDNPRWQTEATTFTPVTLYITWILESTSGFQCLQNLYLPGTMYNTGLFFNGIGALGTGQLGVTTTSAPPIDTAKSSL